MVRVHCLVGVVVVVATAGCSSSSTAPSGTADASRATDAAHASDAGSTKADFGSSACGKCVATACASALGACTSDPDCTVYDTCVDACGVDATGNVSAACAAQCPTGSSSSGATAIAAFTACRTTGAGESCQACGASPADAGHDAPVEAGNPIVGQQCAQVHTDAGCDTCIDDHCCDTDAKCHANTECLAYQACQVDCMNGVVDDAGSPGSAPDGGTCEAVCATRHPSGVADWAALYTCSMLYCDSTCGETAPSACAACTDQDCAEQFADAEGTADGYLFDACLDACKGDGTLCTMQCIQAHMASQPAIAALTACASENCPSCQ